MNWANFRALCTASKEITLFHGQATALGGARSGSPQSIPVSAFHLFRQNVFTQHVHDVTDNKIHDQHQQKIIITQSTPISVANHCLLI